MKNERVIWILCFSNISNEINLLLFLLILSGGICDTFIHVRTSND